MEDYLPVFIISGLVLIFVLTFLLNKRTPMPEGSVEKIDEAACNACNNHACSHHK